MSIRIVIASVLKPVDDVRAYWKIAQSLAKTNKYEVNIIGNTGKKQADHDKIRFHQHDVLPQQKLKRIFVRLLVFAKFLQRPPNILIITTHELLLSALIIKCMTGCKIIYDIQENYAANASMRHGLLFGVMSKWIQFKENLTSSFVDQFWLAEKCYLDELGFTKQKHLILENKALNIKIDRSKSTSLRLLFSGTISTYSGAGVALHTMKEVLRVDPQSEGVFVGQIHDRRLQSILKNNIEVFPNLRLNVSRYPIPYPEILQMIEWANVGLITYQPNKVNKYKIPTKLYEYSRYGLVYLIQENTYWANVGREIGGAIPINYHEIDGPKLVRQLKEQMNLSAGQYSYDYTWENEESKLISSISTLVKDV